MKQIGLVAIGRNEGQRLHRCLNSVLGEVRKVVYVDSGSTDSSIEFAQGLGVAIVKLDMAQPFTAARARNAGFALLRKLWPEIEYVQFVDGDCEIVGDWLLQAAGFLDQYAEVAVVCGRRRERYPEKSIYNFLCDFEWNTPVGQTKSCGGDAMIRVSAFENVHGYRNDLIAGEEPELCVRLRAAGYKIWRLDVEMTVHDAGMTNFGQWFKRTMRGGYAFAEGAYLYAGQPERYRVRESRRAWLWGAVIPLFVFLAIIIFGTIGLFLLLVYPMQIFRIMARVDGPIKQNLLLAFFLVLGKFPEMIGQAKFLLNHLMGRSGRLIEYK